MMVKKERRERLTAAELRLLGQNPNLVTRRIPRPAAKKIYSCRRDLSLVYEA